jgi:hypothetical protein
MAYIPAESGGGSDTIITTHNLGTVGNTVTITAGNYTKIDLTPPETGYIPVGWCISKRNTFDAGSLVYLNGTLRNFNGWGLTIGNCGTTNLTFALEFKVAWAKE